ncbi:MAG: S41 family peptidase [Candidatus Protistobacter heckmanni]|nr:S41 family peptidase [Candidatus Protistobacter heckmanni]
MRVSVKNILLVMTGLVAGVLATLQISATAQNSPGPLPLEELRLLSSVFGQIKRDYVEPVDDKRLLVEAVKGMVSSLDPHSAYLDRKDFAEMQEHTRGRFAGLGIEITSEDGLVKIINPIEDTPAARAGLQAGDLITRLDEKPVRGMTIDQAVRRMRGEPGTKITLTIYRKSEERNFPVTLTRAEIRTQSVKVKVVDPGVAWIRITSFQETTVPDLARKLTELVQKESNLKGLVLDLRNNGGGLLQGAVGVSAAFLPPDVTVVSTNGQTEDAKRIFRATPSNYRLASSEGDSLSGLPAVFKKLPLLVLVNAYSASASEIVAGALQDHKRALIMGKTTFGKGSVQTVRPLSADTAIKLTTAYYYTPNGRSIQALGIQPELPVDQNPDGDPDDVLVTREIDNENHLRNKQKPEGAEMTDRERRRMEELRRLEEENAKKTPEERDKEKRKKPIEFGSAEDFMLQQAVNKLEGKPVKLSQSKLEAADTKGKDAGKAKKP